MVALSFSDYFTVTRFIAGIKCRKINAGPFAIAARSVRSPPTRPNLLISLVTFQ